MSDLRRLFGYMRPYLGRVIFAAVLLVLAGALMSAVIGTLKPLSNEVFNLGGASPAVAADPGRATGFDVTQTIKKLIPAERMLAWARDRAYVEVPLLLALIFFVRAVFLYFGQYFVVRSGAAVIRDLRVDLYGAIVHQSLRFFQQNPSGHILSRVLGDVARLQKVATDVLADFVRVAAGIPFLLALALLQDWRLTVVALVALPILAYPLVRLSRRLRLAATRSQESMAETASRLTETVTGAKVVQSFAMERFEIGRFRATLDRMLRADLKAARAVALAPAVMEVFGGIAGAALFSYAGRQVARGRITGGDVTVILAALAYLFMSLRKLNTLNSDVQQAIAAARRVFGMMDLEREIRDPAGAVDLPPFASTISFQAVDFAYDTDKVLDRIDLEIRRGELVALVGASGSGKTTLANLVPRFYDPTEGCVKLDGHDLRAVRLASLRDQIGLVTQETVLFDDTVRDNIAYGRDDIPLERVVQAARAAHAHEFIEKLPNGYDTVLGERGTRLSMGQRQRITIARALLKNPPILILDEATSALDSESESLVQQALEELMKGRTSIVIAHRLSTIRRADRIVVMDSGRIVEQGKHRELLAKGGIYARLHALQFAESEA